ncbi:MAG: cytochrome c oxidase subunit II [Chloroflexi bacterium]|nr:cytochrome c oxidase subunit II [Chloroflexota bacterium]
MQHWLTPSNFNKLALVVLALAATSILAACSPEHPQSTFGYGGPVARDQGNLFILIFWIAVAVFIVVEGAIIYAAIRYRRRDDKIPKQVHGNTKLEITWTVLPSIVIAAIAVPTIIGIWEQQRGAPTDMGDVLEVEAIGHRWWFEFRYPNQEVVTANEMHIPVGRPVNVQLASQDVIHSFWVPKLAGKIDMVPLNDNLLWFIAEEPGVYDGQCAEFCGIAHAHMRFRVIAHTEEGFQQWVAGMRTPPVAFESGSSKQQGQTLFATHCKTCHTDDSWRQDAYSLEIQQQDSRWATWLDDIENSRIVSAPNMTHYGDRLFLGAGIKENSRENLIKWINDPNDIKIGTSMQAHAAVYQERADNKINLSSQEVENIADYLLGLVPGDIEQLAAPQITGGTPEERGEQLFVSIGCNACHSLDADTTIVGPSLIGIADRAGTRTSLSAEDYMRESINDPAAFIVDGFTNSMVVPKLPASQVDDLIAYISTLE